MISLKDKNTKYSFMKNIISYLSGIIMKFIKSDECRAIIEIIMALFTLASVILVGVSNHEMKVQRESAYKPVLSIGESTYSCEGNIYYSYFDGGYDVSDEKVQEFLANLPNLTFKLENIGLGIAKDIKCEWSENSIEQFTEYFKLYKLYGSKDLNLDSDGDLQIIKYGESILLKKEFLFSSETPFIKTDNSENNYITIDASVFGYLCLIDAIYCYQETSPKYVLNVSYEDMYSKKYSTEIHINYTIDKDYKNNPNKFIISFKTNTIYK